MTDSQSSSSSSSGGSSTIASMSSDGRAIKIIGANSYSATSIEGGQHLMIDGKINVVVTPQEVKINETRHTISDYIEVIIKVENGEATVLVDGKTIN